ncbi:GntR family transcriptional regulator, partial [Enterobacter hormaechei]|uniref:GntR family transcriptional regulator n=3 Tax=Enterobacterales TaxID=91347 RepID=UPI001EED1E44
MKQALFQQRPYQEVGSMLRLMISEKKYAVGGRLPPEREIADMLEVSRTVVREALIMLEIEGIV